MTPRKRTAWGLADQVLASLGNFAATVVAARMLGVDAFGRFAIVGALYLVLLAVSRGVVSEPVLLRYSARHGTRDGGLDVGAGAIVLVAAGVAFVLAACAGAMSGHPIAWPLAALALCFPGLLLQDYLRFAALGCGRPRVAAAMDGSWLVGQLAAVAVWHSVGGRSATIALALWLVPGALSAVVGMRSLGVWPRFRGAYDWLLRTRSFGLRFAADALIAQGSGHLLVIGVSVVAATSQAAYFRVAQAAFGPLVILFSGVRLAVVPELVRLQTKGELKRFNAAVRRWAIALTALSAVWGCAAWFAPTGLARAAFGVSWQGAHGLVPPTTVVIATGGIAMAAFAGIRALADARGGLIVRTWTGVVTLAAGIVGAAAAGALGASLATACAAPLAAVMWWIQLRRSKKARMLLSSGLAAAPVPGSGIAAI